MAMDFMSFDDIELDYATQARRSTRIQRAQFGDGYSQVLTDGLNADVEKWDCVSTLLTNEEANSLESYLLSLNGSPIQWTPPLNTKKFARPVQSGQLDLGYKNIATLHLEGYHTPANYTVNLTTGIVTSNTILDGQRVDVTLVQAAKNYVLDNGWIFELVSPGFSRLKFSLTQVYL